MKILGLDQGTVYTGYCVIENGNILTLGSIELKQDLNLNTRIVTMCHDIDMLLRKFTPDHLCLEDIYYCPGRYAAFRALAMLRGALIWEYWLKKLTYPIIVSAVSARKHLGIKGNAKKMEIIEFLNKSLNLKLDNEHIADAIVVAKVGYDIANKNLSSEFFESTINLDNLFGRKKDAGKRKK
jgi:Holliday junction resolvasome RuvABC endonuclease subunit